MEAAWLIMDPISLRWVAGERFTHVEWCVHVCGLVPIWIFLGLLIKQTFLDEVFIVNALPSTSPCLGFLRMAMMIFWMHSLFLFSRMHGNRENLSAK